jgi:monoamine oxidase
MLGCASLIDSSSICAAKVIAEAGLDFVVLEARDRIGGRIYTNHQLGLPVDLGASWIHGTDGNPLNDIAPTKRTAVSDLSQWTVFHPENHKQLPGDKSFELLADVWALKDRVEQYSASTRSQTDSKSILQYVQSDHEWRRCVEKVLSG